MNHMDDGIELAHNMLEKTIWKRANDISVSTNASLPADTKEVNVIVENENSNVYQNVIFNIVMGNIPAGQSLYFRGGHYNTAQDNCGATIRVTRRSDACVIMLVNAYIGGVETSPNAIGMVSYR